jgi:peptidoglycan/xylan/chitin deacetylase (PgdA/CDA1 family)
MIETGPPGSTGTPPLILLRAIDLWERTAMKRRSRAFGPVARALALTALVGACGSGAAPAATPGVTPLAPAPPPPVNRPVELTDSGPVPVIKRIATGQRVVFITVDDGAEKDPQFITMMRDLRVPITMFLMNDAIKDDYSYFRPLQALGDSIQNHTLHHPVMTTLSEARQKAEVCGDQRILTHEYGTAPYLFRPPYGAGAHSAAVNRAVQACGPRAIVYWTETMQITGLRYQTADRKLHDGDIILAHFRGPSELKGETMTAMFTNLLKRIQEQGFAVARLDDYIQQP